MPNADEPLRIAVAGGSIGGLCAGLALHESGFDVHVYERHPGPMETRGAGIVVQSELIQLFHKTGAGALPTTQCSLRRYLLPDGGNGRTQAMPQHFTSWEAIYVTLRNAFPAQRYHMGAELRGIDEGSARLVSADVAGHGRIEADVLVCADGAQSPTRRRLLPQARSTYAGYVAWRGTLDEQSTAPDLVDFFQDAFTFSEARSGGHILVYFIPGDGADPTPGRRRLNWVWYVRADEAELERLLVDRNGERHHASLPLGLVADSTVRDLVDLARREVHPRLADLVAATPDPFLQSIIDLTVPRTVFGRLCLLGDAAFVVRPHTAGATAKAARDATVLSAALKHAERNIDSGLALFQESQLAFGREMTRYGVALGERWAVKTH